MNPQVDSLEKQIADLEANLNIINEKCGQYVQSVDIPIQLEREKQRTEVELKALHERRKALGQGVLPAPIPPEFANAPNPYRGLEPFEAEHAANYGEF